MFVRLVLLALMNVRQHKSRFTLCVARSEKETENTKNQFMHSQVVAQHSAGAARTYWIPKTASGTHDSKLPTTAAHTRLGHVFARTKRTNTCAAGLHCVCEPERWHRVYRIASLPCDAGVERRSDDDSIFFHVIRNEGAIAMMVPKCMHIKYLLLPHRQPYGNSIQTMHRRALRADENYEHRSDSHRVLLFL